MSFLNRISTSAPTTAANVLLNSINLVYHPNLMAMAGQSAVDLAKAAYTKGGYILAVEGGVPTAFGGRTCWAWTYNGVDVTFQQVVTDLAAKACGNPGHWHLRLLSAASPPPGPIPLPSKASRP